MKNAFWFAVPIAMLAVMTVPDRWVDLTGFVGVTAIFITGMISLSRI